MNRHTCLGIEGQRGHGKSLFSISPFTFFNDEIYLGYSAAISGKLLDHLAPWPPQRQPCCSQKTSIRKLQTGFDANNWLHLSPSPTQCLHRRLLHKHLRFQTNVERCNKLNLSTRPHKITDSFQGTCNALTLGGNP